MRDVYVAGAATTAFGRHGVGTGVKLATGAATDALAAAGLTFDQVELLLGGTAHPLSPRPVYVGRELGLTGVPIQHVSNASATGLCLVHEAFEAVRTGRADVVLAVAYDAPETDVPTAQIIAGEGHLSPVVSFALTARERMETHGTTPEHLAMVAAKNWNYARSNPFAARRSPEPVTVDMILKSRMVADPLTSKMVTPWCEGASAVVFSSRPSGATPAVRVASSALTTARYAPDQLLEGAIGGPPELSRATAAAAIERADVTTDAIDVVQIHDGFAIEELIYYELLGFIAPGEAESLVEQGAFGPGSRGRFGLPEFSTDGGLIARGHPGAPTGLAQIVETVRRLTSGGDKVGMCHLLGAGGVCAAQVLVHG
ncbi:thiolase family protein [Streptosporangium sp. NPDC051022]|uniref:thiolase family protein n=1 Tax=Streptosporangium sp. NPDC051022 TaxID=3155752 RepID=UPI00341DA297